MCIYNRMYTTNTMYTMHAHLTVLIAQEEAHIILTHMLTYMGAAFFPHRRNVLARGPPLAFGAIMPRLARSTFLSVLPCPPGPGAASDPLPGTMEEALLLFPCLWGGAGVLGLVLLGRWVTPGTTSSLVRDAILRKVWQSEESSTAPSFSPIDPLICPSSSSPA